MKTFCNKMIITVFFFIFVWWCWANGLNQLKLKKLFFYVLWCINVI